MKTILVTGATGFIGSSFINNFAKNGNYKIRCLVRRKSEEFEDKEVEIVTGDLGDPVSLKKAAKDVDVVLHLAAVRHHYISAAETEDTNVKGTLNLLKCCKDAKQFIYTSTYLAYDSHDVYSETKRKAELLVEKSGIPYTILVLYPVFGKGDKTNLTKIIDIAKKYPIIPIIGDGKQVIYPVHVDDLVKIIEDSIVERELGKFAVKGYPMTFDEFVSLVVKELNVKRIKMHVPLYLANLSTDFLNLISKRPLITKNQIRNLSSNPEITDVKNVKHKFMPIAEAIRRTI